MSDELAKKEAVQLEARKLFLTGHSLAEISRRMKLSYVTVSNWRDNGGWATDLAKVRRERAKYQLLRVQSELGETLSEMDQHYAHLILRCLRWMDGVDVQGQPIAGRIPLEVRDASDAMSHLRELLKDRVALLKLISQSISEGFPLIDPQTIQFVRVSGPKPKGSLPSGSKDDATSKAAQEILDRVTGKLLSFPTKE